MGSHFNEFEQFKLYTLNYLYRRSLIHACYRLHFLAEILGDLAESAVALLYRSSLAIPILGRHAGVSVSQNESEEP